MEFKKLRKAIGRFLGWVGLNSCSLIIKFFPEAYLYGLAKGIGALAYFLAGRQRRIALESLSIAFGREKSREEIEKISKECFAYMAKAGLEVLFLLDKPQLLKQRIKIAGKENLESALAKGRGAILVSAHFGNFPLLLARLCLEGYKTSGIMRPMRDAKAEKFFSSKRKKFGIKTIYTQPRKTCVSNIVEALRNNEMVFIPLDQNFGSGGVFVEFFGREAATATGPVIIAQRTKAAVMPCFIVREKDDTHKIIFEPEINLTEGNDPKEAVRINIQRLTYIIEAYIRKYPAEWGWIHRRWKSKPE